MEIVKLKTPGDRQVIDLAIDYLKKGLVIAYPTETVYGLGCDATNKLAVKKIYQIKGRSEAKSLLMLVSSQVMARKFFVFNRFAVELAKKYWPGALTLVLPLNSVGKKIFKLDDAGIRISSLSLATALVKKLKLPIISTSANPTGQPAPQTAMEVFQYFKDRKFKPDLILDGGRLKNSKGSTIVKVTKGQVEILRAGDLKINKTFLI